MEHFLRVFQALTAIEAMMKRVARQAGLGAMEGWVLLMCGTLAEPVTGAWLARQTGRSRQHVQRSLEELAQRGLLAALAGPRGRTAGWELTARGRRVAEMLDALAASWMTGVTRQVDLEVLADSLERVVTALITRRGNGWARGVFKDHSPDSWAHELEALVIAEELNEERAKLCGDEGE